MMPGESRSQAADAVTAGSASCVNCDTLQQNLNEYVTALIALKQKIIDTDHVLTEYQKKCDELQKTERDCKTLRDQLDELLQKFAPLEKCKEEMDAMRVELEEKRSSIKMYQQTHLEFNELQQEQARNDAAKKKLESRVKRLEETTAKQNAEIKQLKREKTTLERNLKKTQEKLTLQQKNGIKVLKDAQTQNVLQDVATRIDTNKVKVLLEEIWKCIEKPSVQEKPNKSPGKRGPSQKKTKMLRSSLSNPSHSSPMETSELPTSSLPCQLECNQEENNFSKMDESLADEGLKSNGDSAFYDDKTIELTQHKDPTDSANTSSSDIDSDDGDDDDEQDALSRQLQEILDWTEPLPPQLSPLPCSPSSKKQILFGDITDSSDDEDINLPGRNCSESVAETDQVDNSGCTKVLTTDQASLMEAGISASVCEQLPAEKMDCSEAEIDDLNEQCSTKTEVEAEFSDSSLIVEDAQCRNENGAEVQSLFEETPGNCDVTRNPEMCDVDSVPVAKNDTTSPQYNCNADVKRDDDTESSENTVVSVESNLETVEPEFEKTQPCSREEYGVETCVKEVDKEQLVSDEVPASGQLETTFEAMEVSEFNCNSLTCHNQKSEGIITSVLATDMEHTTSECTTKKQIGISTGEEEISFSQLNNTEVDSVALMNNSDECIPAEDMEVEERNCNSFTLDRQKSECSQILLQPTDVELSQTNSLTTEQNLNKMEEKTPSAETYCSKEIDVSQHMSETCTATGCAEVEEVTLDGSMSNHKDKCILTSMSVTDSEQTPNELAAKDQIQAVSSLADFECPTETSISQDKAKNHFSPSDKEININSVGLTSDNQKDEDRLTSVSIDTEELDAKEHKEIDRIQETGVVGKFDNSVIAQDRSKDHFDTEHVVKGLDSTASAFDSPNNEPVVLSEPEFIQQAESSFIIKEKDSFSKLNEVSSHESDCSDVIQESSICSTDTEMDEVELNSSTSDVTNNTCTPTLVPFSTRMTEVETTANGQDYLKMRELPSPLFEFDSSEISGVTQDQSKDYLSTHIVDLEEGSSNGSAFIECTLISVQSSIEESETKSIIEEDGMITKTSEAPSPLESDCSSVLTDLAEDKSSDCTFMGISSKSEKPNFLSTGSESTGDAQKVEDLVCETAVDKWNEEEDKVVENEKEECHMGEISNQESSTDSTQICEMNLQNSEAEASVLVRKIKRKQWHSKVLTPEEEKQEAINQKVVELDTTADVSMRESSSHDVEAQIVNQKLEAEHHTFSVHGHVTVQCDKVPFSSVCVSEGTETICKIESVINAKEDQVAIHPDSIESKTEPVTLDKDFSQDICQTPAIKENDLNSEGDKHGDNTVSRTYGVSAPDLDTPAIKNCENEPLSESSTNTDRLLGCARIENKCLENNCLQNDPEIVEKLRNSSDVCFNKDNDMKEKDGLQTDKNTIGIVHKMPNCISNVKTMNNSTNTPTEGISGHVHLVQTVDSSTQTELMCVGSQTVLYTSSDLKAAPQTDIVEASKVGTPNAKQHSNYCDLWNPSLPDVPSDHRRSIYTVASHDTEALFESTVDNSVAMESFGTSECEHASKKTAKTKKVQLGRRMPRSLAEGDGDLQPEDVLQKSNVQSTCKSRAVLRRNRRSSNLNNPPVQASADTSAPALCTQEIHQVMLEMGDPLPPLLPPLVATPPRAVRAAKPISPLITTSSTVSLCSPVDDLASPSKETTKAASVSPPLDYTQQKSPLMQSPSPLEFGRHERIQSSPLQFCTATPKHAVPVPGRLPQSASTSGSSALPQENSVKILDAMYPNLSARARTLNILRGNVQLSIRSPTDSENQAGAVNQIMGFKAINSSATAFVKAGSNSRSEGSKPDGYEKDLEQQHPAVAVVLSTVDRPKKDQKGAKRNADDDGSGKAKRVKVENSCQNGDSTTDLIISQESSTVNVIDTTKPLCNGLMEQKAGYKAQCFSQPLESINSSEEALASALMKITKSCFDLLPVIRSHVFVGNIPHIPVLRDEEKEVICELSGNKELTEALMMAILKKLKVEQMTLDGNCLQALSRVYVAICRQQGDLERARILSYNILKEDFPDSSKLLLLILSVWQNIFSTQGPVNKAMQAVAKQRAKGDVLNCLSAYLNWEKNSPLDISPLVLSFLIAMQQSPKVGFRTSNEYGMDFNDDMWELIYAIDLLCSQQPWSWTHNNFIRTEVWPVMDKWMKRRRGQANMPNVPDATVAGVMRLIGHLGQQGLKKESLVAVRNMAAVMNQFLQQAFQEVPYAVSKLITPSGRELKNFDQATMKEQQSYFQVRMVNGMEGILQIVIFLHIWWPCPSQWYWSQWKLLSQDLWRASALHIEGRTH
ncbi:little elongation complex subunit 1 isoform X3 [Chiloscyllium plagiosum]|uniref:little elongation complex subunit 1 isoform X3 n=1 Tax=Chiloscyllium plagiosum TaxID=36176 RepID=UPI001CB82521|nr:little elongation complex subunit 1 isoform X3 [Chiloscyllium plagiosum]